MILMMLIFGLITVIQATRAKGPVTISRTRRIRRTQALALGLIMLAGGVVVPFFAIDSGLSEYIAIVTGVLTSSIALAIAEKVEQP
jgi:hypothetical protein